MDKFWLILTSVPTEGWVGLLSALFGSLLTTVGVLLSNRANRQQLQLRLEHEERLTRERLLRDRLEELYVLVSHWINDMFADHARLTLVMRGHTDYNQYLNYHINTKTGEKGDFYRMKMIIGSYGGHRPERRGV